MVIYTLYEVYIMASIFVKLDVQMQQDNAA